MPYTTHLGRLVRDSDGKGDYYKLRITNHLSSLIHQDSTNVNLGVIVSQNVAVPNFQEVLIHCTQHRLHRAGSI